MVTEESGKYRVCAEQIAPWPGRDLQNEKSPPQLKEGVMTEYKQLNDKLASGWNTWNTYSILSHVLMPEAFALNLCIKEYAGQRLRNRLS